MTYTVKVRKLRAPAPNAPTATFIAHLVHIYADGSQLTSGAWFGNDKDELKARVLSTVRTESQELNVWNS